MPDAVEFSRDGGGIETVTSGDGVAASRPYDAPAWAEDAVIYEIYVRTFAGESDASPFERYRPVDSSTRSASTPSGSRRCSNDQAPHRELRH